MQKYAIIQTGGKQYKAAEGEELLIEKLAAEPKSLVTFNEVLLVVDEAHRNLGKPFITGVEVQAEMLEQTKGPKIRVATYKAKSKYRKVKGHRQSLTRVKITRIVTREKGKKTAKPKTKPESRIKKQELRKPKVKK